jgi:hypothetical protein
MEMRLAIVRLLYSYDLESADGAPLWNPDGQLKHMKSFMVWDVPPLNVIARPRKQ